MFNPTMLRLACGSRGQTQTAFSKKMSWSQGKTSKVLNGLLEPSRIELNLASKVLEYPVKFFETPGKANGFGSCCTYFRKRKSVPIKSLSQLEDVINVRRLQIAQLLRTVPVNGDPNFPRLDVDDYDSPRQIASILRAAWNLPRGAIENLVETVEAAGAIVLFIDFGNLKIDAVSQRAPNLPPVIFINKNNPMDRCRWSLAHEIGHLVMHHFTTPNAEAEADIFASEFLLPESQVKRVLKNLNIAKAADLKLEWKVSMQALIRSAKDLGVITPKKYTSLCVRISQLGYRLNEPNEPDREKAVVLDSLLDHAINEFNYSIEELSEVMLCNPDEFVEVFYNHSTGNGLSVFR